uniref:trypsin n=1 Tax=Culicoides sonorensis TaxID=179676 RepID=Q5QBG0_CULSO|nr:serine protease [Culicoides sonorensis]
MKFQLLLVLSIAFHTYTSSSRLPLENRIVGGKPVDVKDFPYQVSLESNGGHYCGGVVVSENWVLTAGHCGTFPQLITLRVGSSYNSKDGYLMGVSVVYFHPEYDFDSVDYDFALLKLNGTLKFGETVQPVKLPERDQTWNTGTEFVTTGWGETMNPYESSDQLRGVTVPIVDHEKCKKALAEFAEVTPRMVCAGYPDGGKDSCQGDSGGPLTHNGTLVGLVSWGYNCALPNYPGVYTRVAAVRDWVKSYTGV